MIWDIIIYLIVFVIGVGTGYCICKNGSAKAEKLYQELKEEYEEFKAKHESKKSKTTKK